MKARGFISECKRCPASKRLYAERANLIATQFACRILFLSQIMEEPPSQNDLKHCIQYKLFRLVERCNQLQILITVRKYNIKHCNFHKLLFLFLILYLVLLAFIQPIN